MQGIRCGGGGLAPIWMGGWSCESAFECFNKFEDEIMSKKESATIPRVRWFCQCNIIGWTWNKV